MYQQQLQEIQQLIANYEETSAAFLQARDALASKARALTAECERTYETLSEDDQDTPAGELLWELGDQLSRLEDNESLADPVDFSDFQKFISLNWKKGARLKALTRTPQSAAGEWASDPSATLGRM